MADLGLLHGAASRGRFQSEEELKLYGYLRALTASYITRYVGSSFGKNIAETLTRLWQETAIKDGNVFPCVDKIARNTVFRDWLTNHAAIVSSLHEHVFCLEQELSDAELVIVAKTVRMLLAPAYIRDNKVTSDKLRLVYGLIYGECDLFSEPKSKRR